MKYEEVKDDLIKHDSNFSLLTKEEVDRAILEAAAKVSLKRA